MRDGTSMSSIADNWLSPCKLSRNLGLFFALFGTERGCDAAGSPGFAHRVTLWVKVAMLMLAHEHGRSLLCVLTFNRAACEVCRHIDMIRAIRCLGIGMQVRAAVESTPLVFGIQDNKPAIKHGGLICGSD